jgi:hypothetical protein
LKAQIIIDKNSEMILDLRFGTGKTHDFRIFKESFDSFELEDSTKIIADSGYQGLNDIHFNSFLPMKKLSGIISRNYNRFIAKRRICVEHVIGKLKKFNILSSIYRNRRSRFELRFSLIAGIYNWERGR